jgi:hypothetical protein
MGFEIQSPVEGDRHYGPHQVQNGERGARGAVAEELGLWVERAQELGLWVG